MRCATISPRASVPNSATSHLSFRSGRGAEAQVRFCSIPEGDHHADHPAGAFLLAPIHELLDAAQDIGAFLADEGGDIVVHTHLVRSRYISVPRSSQPGKARIRAVTSVSVVWQA